MELIKKAVDDKALKTQLYAKRGTEQMPIIDTRSGSFSSDTMFFDLRGKSRAIFCAIELTSRIGFIRLYKHQKPNAEECVKFLKELKEIHELKAFSTDPGVEYNNKMVKDFCQDNHIALHFYDVAEKTEKAIIERFNRSVRELLTIYTMKIGWNWHIAIQDIEDFYNNRYHSTIKMKPIDVKPKDRERIILEASRKAEKYRTKLNEFVPGTKVRVWVGANPELTAKQIANQEFNKKFGARWTNKIYTVKGSKGYKVELEGTTKRISPRDLLIVPKDEEEEIEIIDDEAVKEKAKQRKITKLNREGLNEFAKSLKESKATTEPQGITRRQTRSQTKAMKKKKEAEDDVIIIDDE